MIARQVIFSGRVQGVGFRYTVKNLARGYDVTGWVRNLDDGTVEMQCQGDADEVRDFIAEIRDESEMADRIRNTIIREAPLSRDVTGFSIIR